MEWAKANAVLRHALRHVRLHLGHRRLGTQLHPTVQALVSHLHQAAFLASTGCPQNPQVHCDGEQQDKHRIAPQAASEADKDKATEKGDKKDGHAKSVKEVEQAALEAQVFLKSVSRFLEVQSRPSGAARDEIAKVQPMLRETQERLDAVVKTMHEWTEKLIITDIMKEAVVRVREAEESMKIVVQAEEPFTQAEELLVDKASSALAERQVVAAVEATNSWAESGASLAPEAMKSACEKAGNAQQEAQIRSSRTCAVACAAEVAPYQKKKKTPKDTERRGNVDTGQDNSASLKKKVKTPEETGRRGKMDDHMVVLKRNERTPKETELRGTKASSTGVAHFVAASSSLPSQCQHIASSGSLQGATCKNGHTESTHFPRGDSDDLVSKQWQEISTALLSRIDEMSLILTSISKRQLRHSDRLGTIMDSLDRQRQRERRHHTKSQDSISALADSVALFDKRLVNSTEHPPNAGNVVDPTVATGYENEPNEFDYDFVSNYTHIILQSQPGVDFDGQMVLDIMQEQKYFSIAYLTRFRGEIAQCIDSELNLIASGALHLMPSDVTPGSSNSSLSHFEVDNDFNDYGPEGDEPFW